jgi:hypothetical protein
VKINSGVVAFLGVGLRLALDRPSHGCACSKRTFGALACLLAEITAVNIYKEWFRRVLIAGAIVNLTLALPSIVAPDVVLAIIRQRPCGDLVWGRFAALLVVLVTLTDIPAAINPLRYRALAWLVVFNRGAGVVFFMLFCREYLLFGLLDLTFGALSLPLLYLLERRVATSDGSGS